jgi:hypothetical protein
VHKCAQFLGVPQIYHQKLALQPGEYVRTVAAATRGGSLAAAWCLGYLQVTTAGSREQTVTLGRLSEFNQSSLQVLPRDPGPAKPVFGFHGSIGNYVDKLSLIVCERREAAALLPAADRAGSSGLASAVAAGNFVISSKKCPSYCLDVWNSHERHTLGNAVKMFPQQGSTNQAFIVKEAEGGFFTLSPFCCGPQVFVALADDQTLCIAEKEALWRITPTLGGHVLSPCGQEGMSLQLSYALTPFAALPLVAAAASSSRKQVWLFSKAAM